MKLARSIGLLLSFVMVLASLAGCQTPGNSTNSASPAATQQQASAESAAPTPSAAPADPFGKYDPPITITMVTTLDATKSFDENDPEKKSMSENRWNNAFRDMLGINLEYKWIAPDADSNTAKWNTAVASGDVPDAARVDDATYKMLLDNKQIADMTAIYDQYASPEFYKVDLNDDDLKQMWYDGGLRGIPGGGVGYYSTLLFVRQDWLDKLNLQVPKTVGDVINVAKAFKDAKLGGDDTIGILFAGPDYGIDGHWDGFMNGYGAYVDYWLQDGDKLVYSNVQDKMKDALLSMQALYKDGVMNKDFSVTTSDLAQEQVANGKVGLFYGTAYATTTSISTLEKNDKNAKFINVYPPSITETPIPIQTDTPRVAKIFVSAKCKNPEAIVKMVNLTNKLFRTDYLNYGVGEDGWLWIKYMPWGGFFNNATYDIKIGDDIRTAEKTGVKNFQDKTAESYYNNYLQAKEGKSEHWWVTTFGEGGSYTTCWDAYTKNLLLRNAFTGLPTQTMTLKQKVINDNLKSAMLKVIMGSDISEFDSAVKDWYNNGGQDITNEVNEWFQSLSK